MKFSSITLSCAPAEADAAWQLLTSAEDLPPGGVTFVCSGRAPVHVNRDAHGRLALTPSAAA